MIKSFPKLGKIGIKEIGVSLVSLGMGLGSGEFILWPLLTVTYGYGILWGALLGITIQLVLILEIQRYTSVKGEDFISGVYRLNRYLPLLLLVGSILGFGWPGFTASAGELLVDLAPGLSGVGSYIPSVLLLICAGVLLVGRNIYSKIEPLQSGIVTVSFILISYLSLRYVNSDAIEGVFRGFIGMGDGYSFFPRGVDISIFLGAIAYAGTGGVLILSQSFYTIEERHGMSKYFPILSLWNSKKVEHEDIIPDSNGESVANFKALRRFQLFENSLFFWFLGITTIVLLSILAYNLLTGVEIVSNSLDFLRLEAGFITSNWGNIFGKSFLLVGALSLISVQIGIYDITGRISVNVFRKFTRFKHIHPSTIYVFTILVQLLIGEVILVLGFNSPVWLLVVGAVINALSMALISILTVFLNIKVIPKSYQPSMYINGFLILASIFYVVLFLFSLF